MNFNEQLELGKKLITENIDKALILFENLKTNYSNEEELLFELGKVYYIKQNYVQAKKNLELIKNKKNNYHLNLLLSKVYKSLDKNFSALRILLKLYQQIKDNEIEKEIINIFLTTKKDILAIKFLLKNNKQSNNLKDIIKFYLNYITTEVANNKFDDIKDIILKAIDIFKKYTNDDEYLREKNILLNEYEIGTKQVVLKSKPRRMTVFLTNKCILKCKMCPFVNKPSTEIKKEALESVKKLLPFLENVVWLGGEAFLYKNFYELINIANKYNVKQNIITNGLLLEENIIKKLMDYKIDLNISIDSTEKETYENIRVGAKFEDLIHNLNLLSKYKVNDIKLILTCVISKWNINENFVNFVHFAKKYKFDEINFTLDLSDTGNNIIIDNFNKFRDEIYLLANKNNINILFLLPMSKSIDGYIKNSNYKNNKFICLKPFKNLLLSYNELRFFDFCKNIGNTDNDTIENIWNSENAINYRRRMFTEGNIDCINVCSNNNLDFQRFKM